MSEILMSKYHSNNHPTRTGIWT